MKTYIITVFLFVTTGLVAQLKIPSLSPSASLSQNIGLSTVEVHYARPSKKGRKIFGNLLPYGELWRAGANTATKFSFSKAALLNGKRFEKGDYSILVIPNQNSWVINWYVYSSSNWNAYVEKTPIATFKIPVKHLEESIETLSIGFKNNTLNSADLVIGWDMLEVIIPIKVVEKQEIIASIEKTLSGPTNSDYFQAALYYHETNTDLNKALMYIQNVTASDKALFFQVTREALILKDLNRNKDAVKAAKRALLLSKKAKNKDFIKINKNLIKLLG